MFLCYGCHDNLRYSLALPCNGPSSKSGGALFSVAPPVHCLNVVGVIVPPCAAHTAWADVIGNHIAVIGELLLADTANAVLGNDLPVEQLAHLPVRAQLPVSAWMLRIVDAPDANLPSTCFLRDCLPATTGEGAVYGTELISTESHEILL